MNIEKHLHLQNRFARALLLAAVILVLKFQTAGNASRSAIPNLTPF